MNDDCAYHGGLTAMDIEGVEVVYCDDVCREKHTAQLENERQNDAEAAYERQCSAYYGGAGESPSYNAQLRDAGRGHLCR